MIPQNGSTDNRVHLVGVDGLDVPVTEKNAVPHDPTDPATWPAWTDSWHWCPGKGDGMALWGPLTDGVPVPEPTEADLADVLPPIAGGSPEAYQPTPTDWAEYEDAFPDPADEVLERENIDDETERALEIRSWYASRRPFSAWLDANGGPAS
jgi:hypothetical protein